MILYIQGMPAMRTMDACRAARQGKTVTLIGFQWEMDLAKMIANDIEGVHAERTRHSVILWRTLAANSTGTDWPCP